MKPTRKYFEGWADGCRFGLMTAVKSIAADLERVKMVSPRCSLERDQETIYSVDRKDGVKYRMIGHLTVGGCFQPTTLDIVFSARDLVRLSELIEESREELLKRMGDQMPRYLADERETEPA